MNLRISTPGAIMPAEPDDAFAQLTALILDTLSPNSRRVYAHTYQRWREFTWDRGLDVFDLSFENIRAFISELELPQVKARAAGGRQQQPTRPQ